MATVIGISSLESVKHADSPWVAQQRWYLPSHSLRSIKGDALMFNPCRCIMKAFSEASSASADDDEGDWNSPIEPGLGMSVTRVRG